MKLITIGAETFDADAMETGEKYAIAKVLYDHGRERAAEEKSQWACMLSTEESQIVDQIPREWLAVWQFENLEKIKKASVH